MKIILNDQPRPLQINPGEPFSEFSSTISACPRIGEMLRIEELGRYRIVEVAHDVEIRDDENYVIGETLIYADKIDE